MAELQLQTNTRWFAIGSYCQRSPTYIRHSTEQMERIDRHWACQLTNIRSVFFGVQGSWR